jgi:hypothetical protein
MNALLLLLLLLVVVLLPLNGLVHLLWTVTTQFNTRQWRRVCHVHR